MYVHPALLRLNSTVFLHFVCPVPQRRLYRLVEHLQELRYSPHTNQHVVHRQDTKATHSFPGSRSAPPLQPRPRPPLATSPGRRRSPRAAAPAPERTVRTRARRSGDGRGGRRALAGPGRRTRFVVRLSMGGATGDVGEDVVLGARGRTGRWWVRGEVPSVLLASGVRGVMQG